MSRFLSTLFTLSTLALPIFAAPPMHWEKMRVYHAPPSVVFSRLGLTRMTRLGYTRDGAKKSDPDPKFPPDVLDIVPVDNDKMLLARGTDNGLAKLRQRVTAADVAAVRWRLNVVLTSAGKGETKVEKTIDVLEMDKPATVTLEENGETLAYQIKAHDHFDGTATVTCASGVPLPMPPTETGDAAAVYVPTLAWTKPQTRTITAGEPDAVFDDREAERRAAREKLAVSGEGPVGDFTLRVTLTPENPL